MISGIFTVLIYTLALIYKLGHLLMALVCPVTQAKIKRNWMGHPSDYSRFENEFDFEADVMLTPDFHRTQGNWKYASGEGLGKSEGVHGGW